MKATISISDPWELSGDYQFEVDCVLEGYAYDRDAGSWRCTATTEIGIGLAGNLSYSFLVKGRHHQRPLIPGYLVPAGFSSLDRPPGQEVCFIGALRLARAPS